MPPVTRFAAFKYKTGVTPDQQKEAFNKLLQLYVEHAALINQHPTGGRNTSKEGLGKGFDVGFTAEFQSEAARDEFVVDAKHIELREYFETIVEDVIIFDFIPGQF